MKSQIKAELKPTSAQLSSQIFLMEIRFWILLRCLPTQSPSSTFIYTSYRSPPPPADRLTSFIFIILSRRRCLPKSQFLLPASSDKAKTNVTRKLFGSSRPSRGSAFVSIFRASRLFSSKVSEVLCLTHSETCHGNATQHEITQNARLAARRTKRKSETMKNRGSRKSFRARLPLHGNDIKVL